MYGANFKKAKIRIMKSSCVLVLLLLMILPACQRQSNEWEGMDYAKIARENYRRENDNAYIPPPSVTNCVDDDLYNCNRTSGGGYYH